MQNNNKNITPRNHIGKPHGYWVYLGKNKLSYKCFFVNGFIHGYDIIKTFGEIRHSYYAR